MIKANTDQALARLKAETLIESLDWLREFHGRIVVVKFGGNAMVDEQLQLAFAQDMAYLRFVGIKPVVVHGGGPQITARLAEIGIESEFRAGMRYTDEKTMSVVRDVLRNTISKNLANFIEESGAQTVVLSGEDDSLFRAVKVRVRLWKARSIWALSVKSRLSIQERCFKHLTRARCPLFLLWRLLTKGSC